MKTKKKKAQLSRAARVLPMRLETCNGLSISAEPGQQAFLGQVQEKFPDLPV